MDIQNHSQLLANSSLFARTRRSLLKSTGCGFAYLALQGLLGNAAKAANSTTMDKGNHFPARASRIIFLYMHGGPSHVDTFDYKPELQKNGGKSYGGKIPPNIDPSTAKAKLLPSPWKFKKHGECGHYVSELFPNVANHVDDICFLHGMHTNGQSHAQAVSMIHTGDTTFVRPSVGAWVSYGLQSENDNLPSFITISPTAQHGGVRNYGNAFLPSSYQATTIGRAGLSASKATINYLNNSTHTSSLQSKQLEFIQQLNQNHLARSSNDKAIEGVIQSYEMAYNMQNIVPDILDLQQETSSTMKMYGIGDKSTDDFGRQCLLARRFAEQGVRFIQVTHRGKNSWDQHGGLSNKLPVNCRETDKPIAGLLADLKQRGLLEDTLVLWGGEFGRTPVAQSSNGRDHCPQGFTLWLAGGGVKPGISYGATDEVGYHAAENKMHMHDLHATLLALMGVDHTALTYRYAGRDFRLTDVYGRVAKEIFV